MNRRELIKAVAFIPAIAAAPVVFKGEAIGKALKLEPDAKYLIFINELSGISIEHFCSDPELGRRFFPGGAIVYSVQGDIDEAIRLYKL